MKAPHAKPGKMTRSRTEFAPIKGKSTAKTVKKVQRLDDASDRKMAKKYGVRFV